MNDIGLLKNFDFDGSVELISKKFNLKIFDSVENSMYFLEMAEGRLQARNSGDKDFGSVFIAFESGKTAHRRIFGSAKNESIAKAVGWKKNKIPQVLDLTAGMGQDAFVLASIGCRVHMIERNNVVAALLFDGLRRAGMHEEIGSWVSERMSLSFEDSLKGLKSLPFSPDVVYIDSMFPEKKKSSRAKKELQFLKRVAGSDPDQSGLLDVGRKHAKSRVVVKRPNYVDFLNKEDPNMSIKSKNYRFDVYLI